ncbi:hypothetical protein GbCGDNIH4_7033 [Granulibacter bethesdensis CGDNIH4]|nr:hypothetical protein GbCGDNIH4_7033 [Granulibacter bethesdensis CGDNIH4]
MPKANCIEHFKNPKFYFARKNFLYFRAYIFYSFNVIVFNLKNNPFY